MYSSCSQMFFASGPSLPPPQSFNLPSSQASVVIQDKCFSQGGSCLIHDAHSLITLSVLQTSTNWVLTLWWALDPQLRNLLVCKVCIYVPLVFTCSGVLFVICFYQASLFSVFLFFSCQHLMRCRTHLLWVAQVLDNLNPNKTLVMLIETGLLPPFLIVYHN